MACRTARHRIGGLCSGRPVIIVVALLVAATAAFVRAETLKAQKAPVYAPDFAAATFSPTCRCATRVATMRFRVRARAVRCAWT